MGPDAYMVLFVDFVLSFARGFGDEILLRSNFQENWLVSRKDPVSRPPFCNSNVADLKRCFV